jgi:YbbR domain-containing protein
MAARARGRSLGNLGWLIVSFLLAVTVWLMATIQANPMQERSFASIVVKTTVDEGLLLTEDLRTVNVRVQAQSSQIDSVSRADIEARADLSGLGPGVHTVPIVAEVLSVPARVSSVPSQVTVTLEEEARQQKPVSVAFITTPPIDYGYDEPESVVLQALVSGIASEVSRVATVVAEVDLEDVRNPVTLRVPLKAVDESGAEVDQVSIDPATTSVTVNVYRRDDIKQVAVRPNILFDTLEAGYIVTPGQFEPQSIFVSGTSTALSQIGDTIFTEPISLADRTNDFETFVSIEKPASDLVYSNEVVRVQIGIAPQTTTRQFDAIAVNVFGASEAQQVMVTPETVSVIVTGPVPLVDSLQTDSMVVVIDVSGLAPGNYEIAPVVTFDQEVAVSGVTVLPASLAVTIGAQTPLTPPPTSTP